MKKLIFSGIVLICCAGVVSAGNPDRAGEAGAYELRINPWARSAGLFGMNSARIMGLEAERINVAGLALTRKTEVLLARTHWYQGTDVFINTIGIAQNLSKADANANVLSFSMMAFSFGEIERTTTTNTEGEIGTYKPQFFNMGLGFSREFSKRIYAGAVVRIISERIEDIGAFGFCVDLGIQYVTGDLDNVHFGIALRNVGTPMKFSGDGTIFRGQAPEGEFEQSQSQRTEKFEMPSLLNIGIGYDLYADNLKNDPDLPHNHRISIVVNFTSNSFGKDHAGGGLEYAWKEYFMLRAGYRWEKGITSDVDRTEAHTGFSAGVSLQVPLKKDKQNSPTIGVDYAYLLSSPFNGTHLYGLRFNL